MPTFKAVLVDPATAWSRVTVAEWYGGRSRELEVASDTAVWYSSGLPPGPIRWVLVRDPSSGSEPQAFLSTALAATPERILGWFVSRWRMETTFQEVRTHLGVETQRQWSDLAILRTTPALLGLFSLVAVWADELARAPTGAFRPRTAAWFDKREPTFSDAIAAVRRALWRPPGLSMSHLDMETIGNLCRPAAKAHGYPLPRSLKRGKSSSTYPSTVDRGRAATVKIRQGTRSLLARSDDDAINI